MSIFIDLSNEIKIEARVVNSLLGLFGEIGGLREVFFSIIFILVGSLQSKKFLIDQAETLFRTYDDEDFSNIETIGDRQQNMRLSNYSMIFKRRKLNFF